jgi:general secretion pathway protein F
MSSFAYRAANAAGQVVHGVDEAPTSLELESVLVSRGLYPLDITPGRVDEPRRSSLRSRRADVVDSFRHLATLVEVDFPLDRALATVARVAARADVADALLLVRSRVRAGLGLGEALAEHPQLFPRLAVGMARAGERGGHLAQALSRLAMQLEREQALRARLVSAMLYPAVMLVVGSIAVVVLLLYVLPRLVGILEEAGVAVPTTTAVLLGFSGVVATWWPMMLGVVAAVLVLAGMAYRTDTGRLRGDRLLLRVPLVGTLRRRLAASRLGQSLATLLGSGYPVISALEIATASLTDRAAVEDVLLAREEVRAGGRLAQALGRSRAFPLVFVQMVEIGESSGRLPMMLERGALAMEQELERTLERLVRVAEPALILVFGGAIGFVAVALLQAIYGVQAHGL